ncbi:MAG: hypothetical protein MJ237_00980 [bacterium]|nr:hypothetical protein [bacterium]
MIKNKILVIFLLIIMFLSSGYKRLNKYVIQPEKNAFYHNNVGINYLQDRVYYAAIQEFKIAISLSPSTQASAIFYNNLGETYNFIGYPDMAKDCFENAIDLYGLNFQYYINLVDTYLKMGIADGKVSELKNSDNPYHRITLGILYIKLSQTRKGINILDEFCMQEPDLMITPAVKQYIADVIKEKM